jgi:hypothetical protein
MAHSGVRSARKKYPSENPTRKAQTMFIPGLAGGNLIDHRDGE